MSREPQDRRTPLFALHQAAGAKFTSFGGWEMPLQFSGVIDEHRAVRERVGLFDVSHMGEFIVHGKDALSFLQYLTSNDLAQLPEGRAQYTLFLNSKGGVIDDLLVYVTGENEYLLCVNAGTTEKDFSHLRHHAADYAVEIVDISSSMSLIAIQGPFSADVISEVFGYTSSALEYRKFPRFSFQSVRTDWILSRTGYTGEDGFELFIPSAAVEDIWRELENAVKRLDGRRCGLAARDTLRLEAAYPLYGHELTEDRNVMAANVAFAIKPDKGSFIGSDAVRRAISNGIDEALTGFVVLDRGIVREGAILFDSDDKQCGVITSGTKTPSCERPIALGFLSRSKIGSEEQIFAEVRGNRLLLKQVELPFYSARSRKQSRSAGA